MKKKIVLLFMVLFVSFSLTGCTTYIKDKNGSPVKEPTTGQTLAKNILCQPRDKDVLKTYKKYKINIDKLPTCPKFKLSSGKYHGLWETLFIKPLSYIIIQIGKILGNYGLSIIVVTLLIRFILFPFSKKSVMQSENMKKAQKDLNKLEKKYRGQENDRDAQMRKGQEMMAIYKKYDINPAGGCLFAFIQLPLFFAFLESLNRLPIVFEGEFLGLNLGMSPFVKIFGSSFSFDKLFSCFGNGSFVYLILPVLVCLSTYFSFKVNSNSGGNDEQQQQMKTMMNVMLVFIVFTSFTMPTSIILYWVTGSLFTIVQAEMIRRMKNGSTSSKK